MVEALHDDPIGFPCLKGSHRLTERGPVGVAPRVVLVVGEAQDLLPELGGVSLDRGPLNVRGDVPFPRAATDPRDPDVADQPQGEPVCPFPPRSCGMVSRTHGDVSHYREAA